jgi:indolepyruvate ferredoxin oxidoreductase
VARLFVDGTFERQLACSFASWGRLEYHLAPPLFGRRDKETGHLRKQTYGPGFVRLLRWLTRLRRLRGSWFDPFGHTNERRMERRLLADYRATLTQIREALSPENHHLAVALARYPEKIRGYGHVKAATILKALPEAAARRAAFAAEGVQGDAAE